MNTTQPDAYLYVNRNDPLIRGVRLHRGVANQFNKEIPLVRADRALAVTKEEMEHLLHALSCIESELPEHSSLIRKLNNIQGDNNENHTTR